jgi:gamma-glutamylcyclotransferase (GGCT)/AIG2-like uncharacterized protein YtfP
MTRRFFFYGTLMRGGRLSPATRGLARFVHSSAIRGDLVDCGTFPGLIDGGGLAYGEVWEALPGQLEELTDVLDGIEGFREDEPVHSMYLREQRETIDGETVWVYIWNRPIRRYEQLIEAGCWRTYEEERAA